MHSASNYLERVWGSTPLPYEVMYSVVIMGAGLVVLLLLAALLYSSPLPH